MNELSRVLKRRDLIMLAKILVPEYSDKRHFVRILQEDEEILDKMLSDEKLFSYVMENSSRLIRISPALMFAVFLKRVQWELENHPYTIERTRGQHIAVFDTGKISLFLNEKGMLPYLVDMLTSFLKIHSFSMTYQVRQGVWRRFKFSDFDIDSLVRYSRMIEDDLKFHPLKRVADICLFILGVFPEYIEMHEWPLSFGDRRMGALPELRRVGFENQGRSFYKVASSQHIARVLELDRVLARLAENFTLAEKTLAYMTDRWLGLHKSNYFLQ